MTCSRGPGQRAHAPCQHLQLSQDGTAPGFMRRGNAAYLLEQPLVYRGEGLPKRLNKTVLLNADFVHANTHCVNLLKQCGHC